MFHAYAATPHWGHFLNFGLRGVISDIITHAKIFVSQFRGFEDLTPRNFLVSIGLAGQSYNSVSTAVLHCDINVMSDVTENI